MELFFGGGEGEVVVIDIVSMFKKGNPCFFKRYIENIHRWYDLTPEICFKIIQRGQVLGGSTEEKEWTGVDNYWG